MCGIVDQLTVSFCSLELSCRDLVFEQQVNLAETTIFSFWQAEPAPDVAKQIRAGVKETGFGAPIPCCR
jgi:hypothetical protein